MNKEQKALERYPINIRKEKSWNENAITQFGNDLNLRSRNAFIAGYEAKEAEDKWIPIEQHTKGKILRWHKVWQCLVEVQSLKEIPNFEMPNCDWVTATKDNTWPEEAFEPYFMLPFSPPKQ